MSRISPTPRPFEPGTYGWTADDLKDPHVKRLWDQGNYEIVEGVLASLPSTYFDSSIGLQRLIMLVERYLERNDLPGEFATRVDVILSPMRVARVDALFLTPEYLRQQEASPRLGTRDVKYSAAVVPPALIIEAVAPGHEAHDRLTKRRWYAEAQVPHYWLLDSYQQTLECLVLEGVEYRIDQAGRGTAELTPSRFPELILPLGRLWGG